MASTAFIFRPSAIFFSALALLTTPPSLLAQTVDFDILSTINARQAREKGLTGAGVTIGVVDTDVDTLHPLIPANQYTLLKTGLTFNNRTYQLGNKPYQDRDDQMPGGFHMAPL